MDAHLLLGPQWSRVVPESLSDSAALRALVGVDRRLFLAPGSQLALALGLQLAFPLSDLPRDTLQLLLRGGVAWTPYHFGWGALELGGELLLGPHIELFSDPFFGNGTLVGLVAGGRLDPRLVIGPRGDRFTVGLTVQFLHHLTPPEHVSLSVGLGIGGAFGEVSDTQDE